jgi:hypothetical protein
MFQNEPDIWQPHFEIYVKNHWDEVKDLGILELRLALTQKCKSLTREEEDHLRFWFKN